MESAGKFKKRLSGLLMVFICMMFISCGEQAPPARNIMLPALFSDHMVLQQGMEIPVWGKADAGGKVVVEIAGEKKSAVTDQQGKWMLKLPALPYGGPHALKIYGADMVLVNDVMIGEIWICSGQSNMEWQVRNSNDAQREMSEANWPAIRMFTVQKKVSGQPEDACQGAWNVCSPETVGDFSAVGYFFGRALHRGLDVPVGLIHTSWGGTPAESWTSMATLKADSILRPIVDRYEIMLKDYPKRLAEYKAQLKQIEESGKQMPVYHTDKGNQGFRKGWAKADFNDGSWDSFDVPGFWENQGSMQTDGAVWFRKAVTIPASWAGKELLLSLGAIDDFDVTYFNGAEIGTTGEETEQFWIHPRKYSILASQVKPGNAVIAVRIFDHYGQGGFVGPGSVMKLSLKDSPETGPIELAGAWKFNIESALDPSLITGPGGRGLPQEPQGPGHPYSPSGLYNAMLYPLAPYAIKGAIWYQGESNAGRAYQYRTLLPDMIRDWRTLWGQGDFPFGIVQLANYMAVSKEPQESNWAELREAQLLTTLNDPNNGLATIIDIGEADDIHPRNKQDVGKRLALWALVKCYGKEMEYSGPLYRSMSIEDGKVTVTFSHTAKGLKTPDGDRVAGFTLAGKDLKFILAQAQIKGDNVIVWSDGIKDPVAVRYAWADNPVCNLYNSEMLPAVPFRTDAQEGTTYLSR